MPEGDITGYAWSSGSLTCAHDHLLPTLLSELERIRNLVPAGKVFDLGCGNGSVAWILTQEGYKVRGVDASIEGISQAKQNYPSLELETGSAYDDLVSRYGQFPVVISLEVVEHVYAPRDYASTLFSLLEPGGVAIISTPYHGYWKNLALAITGKMDSHFTALWDHGHIKFWSVKTLTTLLKEAGFTDIRFKRCGRVPFLAKSMVVIARRPRVEN